MCLLLTLGGFSIYQAVVRAHGGNVLLLRFHLASHIRLEV
jgi:hypothetical protein